MPALNIVAVYAFRATAERARERLLGSGIDPRRVRLSSDRSASASAGSIDTSSDGGWLGWLFGTNDDDEDRALYSSHVHGERTAVSVLTEPEQREVVEDMLDELSPIDVHEGQGAPAASTMRAGTESGIRPSAPGAPGGTKGSTPNETEQVIPIVEEQLEVGKRTVERRHRIRTRVIEEPIEKVVNLRDERVEIERRPVSGASAAKGIADGDRDIEVVERHEEPVVEKRARAVEEVVIKRDQGSHTETVKDAVRRTEVDIDDDQAERDVNRGARTAPKR